MICTSCNKDKLETDFHIRRDASPTSRQTQSHCKDCVRINNAIWRKTDKGRKSCLASKKGSKKYRFRERILRKYGCRLCPEKDIRVLEFDHIDPSTKIETISKLVKKCAPMEDIKNEIRKCQVLCNNCHIKKSLVDNKNIRARKKPIIDQSKN